MHKFASATLYDPRIARRGEDRRRTAHRVEFNYTPREGYLYVRSRMISSRCNDNFDEFTSDEIKGDGRTTGYRTFVGKPVFVNHHNEDHRRARGIILDARLHEDRNPDGSPDTWVEGLMEVDAVRFPKLAQAILAGHIDRTSMGVDVERSQCSKCANVATTPLEYCHHIPTMKGMRIRTVTASGQPQNHLVRERCFGLRFFENSLLVEEPADPTAFFLGSVIEGPKLQTTAARRDTKETTLDLRVGFRRCALCLSANTVAMAGLNECMDCGEIRGLQAYAADSSGIRNLHEAKKAPKHPSENKFFQANPVGAHHVINAWNESNDDEKNQGKRWYADAHLTAKAIGSLRQGPAHPHGNTHLAAGLIAHYSPQQGWAGNMHNAARSMHEGKGIGGKGSGIFATGKQKDRADGMHQGEHFSDTASPNAHKIRDFQHLVEHGGDADPDHPRVVIDRHALGIAAGRRMSDKDYGAFPKSQRASYDHVASAYHEAAKHISETTGETVHAHQVQAVTWLAQQRKNSEAEKASAAADTGEQASKRTRLDKGRQKGREKAEKGWSDFRNEHLPHLEAEPGTGYDSRGGRSTTEKPGQQSVASRRQGSRDFR